MIRLSSGFSPTDYKQKQSLRCIIKYNAHPKSKPSIINNHNHILTNHLVTMKHCYFYSLWQNNKSPEFKYKWTSYKPIFSKEYLFMFFEVYTEGYFIYKMSVYIICQTVVQLRSRLRSFLITRLHLMDSYIF